MQTPSTGVNVQNALNSIENAALFLLELMHAYKRGRNYEYKVKPD